jgi:hypothetical protein
MDEWQRIWKEAIADHSKNSSGNSSREEGKPRRTLDKQQTAAGD